MTPWCEIVKGKQYTSIGVLSQQHNLFIIITKEHLF